MSEHYCTLLGSATRKVHNLSNLKHGFALSLKTESDSFSFLRCWHLLGVLNPLNPTVFVKCSYRTDCGLCQWTVLHVCMNESYHGEIHATKTVHFWKGPAHLPRRLVFCRFSAKEPLKYLVTDSFMAFFVYNIFRYAYPCIWMSSFLCCQL